jgi:hypothetical protein
MPKVIPSNKILIALQFWNGDKAAALALASFLADLEPKHSDLADFLFVARFDTKHDDTTVAKVSRKFNTHTYTSKGRGTGWPSGCNDLFFGTLGWFYHKAAAGQIPNYKAMFCCEADGGPMRKDWIAGLHEEWDRVNTPKGKIGQAGAWLDNGPDGIGTGHINGNCLLSGDLVFLRWLVKAVNHVNVNVGWDWILAPMFKARGWSDIPKIRSVWRQPMTEELFLAGMKEKIVWWHGCKDDALIRFGRKHL